MQAFKKHVGLLINVFVGLVFIYSGYTKLFPVIETFEFTFVDIGVANWYTAPIIARLMISIELILGFMLLIGFAVKPTIKITIALLLFFIIYLVIIIYKNGNNGNCGCFGEVHYMKPLYAIYKNIFLCLILIWPYKFFGGWSSSKYNKLLVGFVSITAVLLTYIINPIDYNYSSNNLSEKVNYPLDLDLLYAPNDTGKVEIPKVNLKQGKHLIAFLSLTCPHCRIAAKKMKLIKQNNSSLPIYFILNGNKAEKLNEFLEDTKATNIPYSFCLGQTFMKLASAQLPRIYYISDEIIVKKVDYFELNQYDLENWVNQP
ncbi:MAG: DoxX family protein [Bacteroidetes bacterium]|nr:DoxX family protein [Bacteroidota bacterium]